MLARANVAFAPISLAPGEPPRAVEAGSGFLRGARAMSDDGSVVAFESQAPVFGGGFSGQQVLMRDLGSATTTLASVAVDGSPANNGVFLGGLDGVGRRVTFASGASNLLMGVADGKSHVFVRDLATGTTTLLDRSIGGGPSNEGAFEPRISGDGRRVVFTSRAPTSRAPPAMASRTSTCSTWWTRPRCSSIRRATASRVTTRRVGRTSTRPAGESGSCRGRTTSARA